jgi:uncharacterized protein (TIGR02996 family)
MAKKQSSQRSVGEQLEAALVADPDNLATHAAHADWLIEQGDPRGEFIQVQLALEDQARPAKERRELQKREKDLLKKHVRGWLGELAPFLIDQQDLPEHRREEGQVNRYAFRRGWLDALEVPLLTGDLARALAGAPQMRLLSTLVIAGLASFLEFVMELGPDASEDMHDSFPGISPLVASPYLTNVREFAIGGRYELGTYDFLYSSFSMEDLSSDAVDLIAQWPRIESIRLDQNLPNLRALCASRTLTQLRALQLVFGTSYPLEVLAKNPALGNLTYLMCHPQAAAEGAGSLITSPGVRAVLRSPHLKSLSTLCLHQTDFGAAGCSEIIASGALRRLKVLDLAFGSITDDGARLLAECPDLRHLETRDLSHNGLTGKGIKALRATGINVLAEEQHDADDMAYLYEGDIE